MRITEKRCNGTETIKERKYVVVNYGESGYDICIGIFDTPREALGCVLETYLEALGDDIDIPVTMQYEHDEANGDWEQISFTSPKTEHALELVDYYKIYFKDTVIETKKGNANYLSFLDVQ